ncbi:Type II secretion system protein G precursor [Planctopirus ephydatiae]|uniref:Type II secretion system protein G n=1 Tax=Planctopirus ephydatiae TaxID=2528019 RepID=A0A518GU51_9PLAN|nr:prepilin-type N-terminal cleavage/methylation domain-containing protein [Planctopirus ephydatiae]QDV32105.1 Type II secretion system protein G precursor [Planctopirus ephydatiae]
MVAGTSLKKLKSSAASRRKGFTLVEVLIVVVILGILAATVLPQFNAATDDAKEASLRQNLSLLRSQIQMFRFQHDGKFPGSGSTDPTKIVEQLTLASKADLTTAAPGTAGYPFGPYVIGQLPVNPYSGGRAVKIVTDVAAATPDMAETIGDEKVGWIYNPATGEIKANATGNSADGKALDKM